MYFLNRKYKQAKYKVKNSYLKRWVQGLLLPDLTVRWNMEDKMLRACDVVLLFWNKSEHSIHDGRLVARDIFHKQKNTPQTQAVSPHWWAGWRSILGNARWITGTGNLWDRPPTALRCDHYDLFCFEKNI